MPLTYQVLFQRNRFLRRKMSRIIFSLLLIIFGSYFQTYAQENERKQWQGTLYGGLYLNNEQAWQLEPSITWNFHKYIGISLGVELTGQYNQPSRFTMIDGYEAELTENERDIAWVILKPSVVFRSPNVWRSADNYYRLWFQAEPGLSFACPFRNSLTYEIKEFQGNVGHTVDYKKFPNKGLQWFYWNARCSVNFAIDSFIIGAGYYISNLDYYSGRRNVILADGEKFRVPEKQLSQSVFLSVGYTF